MAEKTPAFKIGKDIAWRDSNWRRVTGMVISFDSETVVVMVYDTRLLEPIRIEGTFWIDE